MRTSAFAALVLMFASLSIHTQNISVDAFTNSASERRTVATYPAIVGGASVASDPIASWSGPVRTTTHPPADIRLAQGTSPSNAPNSAPNVVPNSTPSATANTSATCTAGCNSQFFSCNGPCLSTSAGTTVAPSQTTAGITNNPTQCRQNCSTQLLTCQRNCSFQQ
jgi:hypothetical protein